MNDTFVPLLLIHTLCLQIVLDFKGKLLLEWWGTTFLFCWVLTEGLDFLVFYLQSSEFSLNLLLFPGHSKNLLLFPGNSKRFRHKFWWRHLCYILKKICSLAGIESTMLRLEVSRSTDWATVPWMKISMKLDFINYAPGRVSVPPPGGSQYSWHRPPAA